MGSNSKGAYRERELVNFFADAGWGALRLPSSGSATDRELPDVLAGYPPTYHDLGFDDAYRMPSTPISVLWAIELKSGKATTLYVDESEVEALETFADRWGARPLLGARPTTQATGKEHYLLRPEDARRTESSYGLPIDGIEDRARAVVGPDGVERL